MTLLSRRSAVAAVLAVAVGAVVITGLSHQSSPEATRPTAIARSGSAGVAPARNSATPVPQLTVPPVLAGGIDIEIEGTARPAFTSAELAERPTNLQASDRRAWRLTELIDNHYMNSNTVIHAITKDGSDYILNEDGRQPRDVLVVRRNSGEIYIGWLDGGADGRPLADAERPAERIENVAKIALATPAAPPEEPPARLMVIVDGKPRHTVTPDSFAAVAKLQITGQREGSAAAIDISHAFGEGLQIMGLTAGGTHVGPVPPTPDARAVIYLTRRARFKFAWIDASGEPVGGTKQRDVSELVLASSSQVAARSR